MIIINDIVTNDLYVTENTILYSQALFNVYVSPNVTFVVNGIVNVDTVVYLGKNSFLENNGTIHGDIVYGEGTLDNNGIVGGNITKG